MGASELSLGYRFWDQQLLDTALTHSSRVNEGGADAPAAHNERLEFLGDAVLELCVTEILYRLFPHAREGELTHMRSALVNTTSLAALARASGVREQIRMGHGEELQGGRERDPLLADAMEAVIGAAYLDGGQPAARQVVETLFKGRWPTRQTTAAAPRKDFKTLLQEATQSLHGAARGLPAYLPGAVSGPEHAPVFAATVELPDGRRFPGTGVSRRGAEQTAAQAALAALDGEKPAAQN